MDEDRETLLTRRRLLATGAVAVAAATLPATSAPAKARAATATKAKPLPRYTRTGYRRSRFAPHVGTPAQLRSRGAAPVSAQLMSVEDVPYVKGLAGDPDVYTLRFRGPAVPLLAEGIVGIGHKHFGTLELYVTPVPTAGGARDYLAVVNRRVPRSARRAAR